MIGLIGLGLVGTALAENLLTAEYAVIGYDPLEERRLSLERLGGRVATGLQDLVRQVERVILSLPDSEVVQEVVEGPGGIIESQPTVKLIIDTTTGEPLKTQALASRLHARGIHFLDATLSGSSEQIRRREGVFMIGGAPGAFEACHDLFLTLSEKHFYLGPSGTGSKAKLASNLILGLNRLALAEGLVFAEKMGLDLKIFLTLAKATPAYSCAMDVKGEKMIRGDFSLQGKISQHLKDLRIILGCAEASGQPLPLTQTHREILEQAVAAGDGDLDNSAVIRQLRRMKRF